MSDLRPKLEVVEGGVPSEQAPPQPAPAPPRRRVGTLAWVLLGLLALALLGVGHEARRADDLAARVEGLQTELQASKVALQAHQEHLEAVRGAVARLQALVTQEPGAPAPAAPGPAEPR